MTFPEASEDDKRGVATWRVRTKMFVWERPLRPRDFKELGDTAPSGPIMCARVEDLGAKAALLAAAPDRFFATGHFDGYAMILVVLTQIDRVELAEVVHDAWLASAPRRLATAFLAQQG